MRMIITLGLALALTGCASQQKWFYEYGNTPVAEAGGFQVYDRPQGKRLAVRAVSVVSAAGASPASYRAPADAYLRSRGCVIQDGYQLELGAWEFTYQCA